MIRVLEIIGCLLGWLIAGVLWFAITVLDAHADVAVSEKLPFITVSMLIAAIIGAIGSFLAFGADKKWPPDATSIGHILLGFGAALFFTRGSLELLGYLDSSDDVIIFATFLWAAVGYFMLRLLIATVQSEAVASMLPAWLNRIFGGRSK